MNRRRFVETSGRTVLLALAGGVAMRAPAGAQEPGVSADVQRRVADTVQAYDAQGNHRTATEADTTSARWLVKEARRFGIEASLEPFAVSRIDLQSCHVDAGERRIDGVPLFDAGTTGADGVRGGLGPLGSDAEIAVVETQPSRLTEAGSERRRAALAEVRQSRHKAVVLLTGGPRPGLFLLNAPLFSKPVGPPTLQVSSTEREWFATQAAARAEVTLVAHVTRTPARAFNVTARVAGSQPGLPPLVVSTPRSGWWQCASERGGGLACWLELMRVVAAGKPLRDCLFAAFSGHELGGLGIDAYLANRTDLVKRAHAWIHFGANIGAPRQPSLIQASEPSLERWAATAMQREGLSVDHTMAPGATPFGEAARLQRDGGRYVAPVSDTEVFHSVADRWPEAVDVARLARYARAFPNGALELARQTT